MQNDDSINPRWRTDATLKIVISPYLSHESSILMKFGVQNADA